MSDLTLAADGRYRALVSRFLDGIPRGGFSLRGITHEITFPAVVAIGDAKHITAQAQIEIDRTRWGSRYGSGKFFAFLGKHVVNDHIQLHLKIHAERG